MRTGGKRKCSSAPEPRAKRIKTASSSSSSNSVSGPQAIINQEETSSSFFDGDEIEECARILCNANGMPYATFNKAKEKLRDDYFRSQFVEMSWEHRLGWLKQMTPLEMEDAFDQWRKTFSLPQ